MFLALCYNIIIVEYEAINIGLFSARQIADIFVCER